MESDENMTEHRSIGGGCDPQRLEVDEPFSAYRSRQPVKLVESAKP